MVFTVPHQQERQGGDGVCGIHLFLRENPVLDFAMPDVAAGGCCGLCNGCRSGFGLHFFR
jgi:hypothetical protein